MKREAVSSFRTFATTHLTTQNNTGDYSRTYL
jgi:hypothetical protein